MSWDSKFSSYGFISIEGKNVKVFSDKDDCITVGFVDEVVGALWVGDELNITLKTGEVRRYRDRNYYIKI